MSGVFCYMIGYYMNTPPPDPDVNEFFHLLSTIKPLPFKHSNNSSQCASPLLPSCVNDTSIENYLHLYPSDRIAFPHHTPTSENWPPVRSFQRNGHHEIDIFLSATITTKTNKSHHVSAIRSHPFHSQAR